MKRSEINAHVHAAEAFFQKHHFHLPPFSSWTPEDWSHKGPEADAIRALGLGWDVTDLGKGLFEEEGLILFTLRNGNALDPADPKTYAEKIMISGANQVTPWHFHWHKTEDIINRGGGDLVVTLAWATDDEAHLSSREVCVTCDGVERHLPAGGDLVLTPGESVTLPPKLYHQFHGHREAVLVGEVSRTNDDHADNRFLEPLGRFPAIEEDEAPYRYLCHEYPQ